MHRAGVSNGLTYLLGTESRDLIIKAILTDPFYFGWPCSLLTSRALFFFAELLHQPQPRADRKEGGFPLPRARASFVGATAKRTGGIRGRLLARLPSEHGQRRHVGRLSFPARSGPQ